MHTSPAAAACTVLLAAAAARADVVFVNHAASGANNGQTWASAFTSLHAGLAAAGSGDQVWVAKGTYRPAPPSGDRDASFALPSGVEVYGGFAGNETTLAQRDPVLNPTILSGDLNGNDTPGFGNIAENSHHVVTAINAAAPLLDGFTVRSGNADFPGEMLVGGGGFFIQDGSPRIRSCVFVANSAGENKPNIGGFGGALHVAVGGAGAEVLVNDCRFEGNRGDSGGALGVLNGTQDVPHRVIVEDCLFLENAAPHQTGGAVYSAANPFNTTTHQELTFTRCRFEGNSAQYAGAIIDQNTLRFALNECEFVANSLKVGGAAVWHIHTASKDVFPAVIRGCLFQDNPRGALAFSSTSAQVIDCQFLGNGTLGAGGAVVALGPYVFGCGRSLSVIGCLFSGNAGGIGAAVASTCAEQVTIVNSTFAGNAAAQGAAGVFSFAPLTIDNSIFWANTVGASQAEPAQISASGPAAVNHTTIMGLTGVLGGVGNSGADPSFIDPLGPDGVAGTLDDNLRLAAGSPAIDSASNLVVPAALKSDLDGNPRFVDHPAAPDTGVPGGAGGAAIVDRGPYEVQADACYADCNASGTLTIADFACFQAAFVAADPYADCNASATFTIADFACFQAAFVAGCP